MSGMPSPSPLIAACLRVADLRPEVDPLSGEISHDGLAGGLGASDAAALEHALRIAEAWSARVVVVSVGAAAVDAVLREATALGTDVVRVPDDGVADDVPADELAVDERVLARAAAVALATLGGPDLVLCGDRSSDRGTGAFPAFLAHELGAAQALGLVRLTAPSRTGALLAERRLDGGWRERLSVPLPAVCSVEAAGVRLRRASLTGALVAVESPVPTDESAARVLRAARAGGSSLRCGPTRPFEPRTRLVAAPKGREAHERILELTGALAAHDPPTVVGPVGAADAADALLEYLVRHGYLDPATFAAAPARPGESG
jgi:electron transfer flavoprotein beta subunit